MEGLEVKALATLGIADPYRYGGSGPDPRRAETFRDE